MHNSILIPCYEAKVHCTVMLSGVYWMRMACFSERADRSFIKLYFLPWKIKISQRTRLEAYLPAAGVICGSLSERCFRFLSKYFLLLH